MEVCNTVTNSSEDPALAEAVDQAVSGAPAPPKEPTLDQESPLTQLRERVIETLHAMPAYFEFDTTIEGVHATDLQAANTLLGASIEVQVVATLNRLRELWDPDREWLGYKFERQAQTFPDVRLVRRRGAQVEPVLGIELKGWYLFSKEGVPTFRFTCTPDACAEHDLLCVVPWHFSNVTSGAPVAREPWVASARWAAQYRNYWWQYIRKSKRGLNSITQPPGATPYPTKDQQISDVPEDDGGNNFGRIARVKGLMDTFIAKSLEQEALGIPVRDWIAFFGRHSESSDMETTYQILVTQLASHRRAIAEDKADQIADLLFQIQDLLRE